MVDVLPLHSQETVVGALKNALTIAEMGPDLFQHLQHEQDAGSAFGDIARLIRHALSQLGEPNAAAIHDATVMLRAAMGPTAFDLVEPRLPRDVASVILHAQLTGLSPETL